MIKKTDWCLFALFSVLAVVRFNSACHQFVSVLVCGYFLSDIEVAFLVNHQIFHVDISSNLRNLEKGFLSGRGNGAGKT